MSDRNGSGLPGHVIVRTGRRPEPEAVATLQRVGVATAHEATDDGVDDDGGGGVFFVPPEVAPEVARRALAREAAEADKIAQFRDVAADVRAGQS